MSQVGRQTLIMAGNVERNVAVGCPRCEVCGVVIRVRGIERVGAICRNCLSGALPFVGIVSESDFKAAVREYKEGLQSRAGQFQGLRLDPFDDEMRGALKQLDETLRGCAYMGGEEIKGYLKKVAKNGGCSLSLLCHNIRIARGPGLELLEPEIRRWEVSWDIIGLTETWLDDESEKRFSVTGFKAIFASRKKKGGGGVALLVREGLTYRERSDLGTFKEGVFESVFVEVVRGEGRRNELIGVVYRPPGGDVSEFNAEMVSILGKIKNDVSYIMGDFNIDLLKVNNHAPSNDFMSTFTASSFFPLISLPTRLTDTTATLIDNIWTNNIVTQCRSGLVTVRLSDHLPVFTFVEGHSGDSYFNEQTRKRRKITTHKISKFAEELSAWSFDEERAKGIEYNVAKFRNEFRDMYCENFPLIENKKNKRDREKPWLDNPEFKDLVGEKGKLYKEKLRGHLDGEGLQRLAEVNKEVNNMRKLLKKAIL